MRPNNISGWTEKNVNSSVLLMEVLKYGRRDLCNAIFSSLPTETWKLFPLQAPSSTVTSGHTDITAACDNLLANLKTPLALLALLSLLGLLALLALRLSWLSWFSWFSGLPAAVATMATSRAHEFSLTSSGTQNLAKADSSFLHSHLLPEISFLTFSPWRILKNRNTAWSSLSNTKCQYFF